jgi:ribosomal protein S3AE
MKNNVRQMLKHIVEENAVSFKEQTGKILYGKISNRLNEQYKSIAKTILNPKTKQ